MGLRALLHLSVCFLLYRVSDCKEQSCIQENPCLCRFDEFKSINVWPLANKSYTTDSANAKYFLSVCEDYNGTQDCGFTKNGTNKTVTCPVPFSLCKCDGNKNEAVTLGSIKNRNFVDVLSNPNTEKFVYSNGTNVTASVTLVCTEYKETFLSSASNDSNSLLLFSPHACVTVDQPGISTGTKLLIVFFFVLTFYFAFGALLLHFLRGARGIEMIPNLEFWKDLPYLVRDGLIFLFSGCKPTTLMTSEAYDRI